MSLKHERDNALRVLHEFMGYFRSLNDQPIERARISGNCVEVRQAQHVLKNPRTLMYRRVRFGKARKMYRFLPYRWAHRE